MANTFDFFVRNWLEPFSYGLCFAFIFYFTSKQKLIRWKAIAVYYFLATLLMTVAAFVNPNILIYSSLSLLTCICVGMYFYRIFFIQWKKRVVVFFWIVQVAYFIASNFIFTSPKVLDSTAFVILSIGIVFMSFMYMHQILTNVTEEPLSLSLDFWFVSAQLLYYLGSFFIFLTYGYLTQKLMTSSLYSPENRFYLGQLWIIHNVLLFLSSLIISASVLWISFRRKSPLL
jgi:hypothetical protein